MRTRSEQTAILSMLSGDRVLTPFGGTLLDDERRQEAARLGREKFDFDKRQPTHIGSGFLYDPSTGRVAQDPAYGEFERQKHRDALELYDAREEAQFQRETRAADRARERAVDTGTTRLSSAMAKAQLPEIERGIQAIDEELAPYRAADEDLPGMGGIFNKLPPLTRDAASMRQRVADVRNVILKARSGGAVTPQEAERLLEEFSLGMFNTDEDFLKAWDDFKTMVDAGARNVYAGFDDEVITNYERNLSRGDADASDDDSAEQQWEIRDGKPVRVR